MSDATPPVHALSGRDRARRLAAYHWLLESAPHRDTAGMEWTRYGVALLTAGIRWDVVRVPYEVLHPSFARDTAPRDLTQRLGELGVIGPVFCDPYRPFAYFMVPPRTDQQWPRDLAAAGVECLGGTRPYVYHVGVPQVERAAPPGLFWLAPPDEAKRQYVNPEHLHQVLHACVHQSTEQEQADAPQVIA
ncbi:hypothetical protein [Streptomyces cinereospinus]|uniref:DNA primase/polymerase bifunctional N-terminal domain-containing protein n=1 Tax=Streptomyces cinereospinus TaxID=285561 RepID=A0ABV5N402_9ACTN